jgi:phage-related protein
MNVVYSTITKAINTTFKAVTNLTNRADDFFKNIGDGIVSVIDNVGDSLDFIPGRVREGVKTDDFLKKLIS